MGELKKIISVIEALEDEDDVQKVYSNFEANKKILEEITS